ncbi:MAG: hypothetical protein LBJ59_04460 [Zoogloeaceae bacterium]|jgi:hypothetical protein|nr:hypothetical protein [Zoogloeaceae bacterium]
MLFRQNPGILYLHDINVESTVFYVTLFTICVFICLPDFPPMVDMPQHANQVTSLKAMLQGDFIWSNLVELNIFTPYWVGYIIYLLLALIFPILIATKLVICLTFFAFVLSFSFLRKKFDAPSSLDWLLIPAFFGFAYEFGFLNFLLAAPVGVLFYVLILNFIQNGNLKSAFLVLASGILLAFSHLLIFAFFGLTTFIHILLSKNLLKNKKLSIFFFYVFFALILLGFLGREDSLASYYGYKSNILFAWQRMKWSWSLLGTNNFQQHLDAAGATRNFLESFSSKFVGLPAFAFGGGYSLLVQIIFFMCVLLLPFACGYRFSRKIPSYSLLFSFLLVWFTLPHYIMNTLFIFQRFAMFFIPAYILCFVKNPETNLQYALQKNARTNHLLQSIDKKKIAKISIYALIIIALLFHPLNDICTFMGKARELRTLIERIPGNQRALSLIFHKKEDRNPHIYNFLPNWYQSMNNGWVDLNFAGASPQIVRFRPEKIPEIRLSNHGHVIDLLQWMKTCDLYDLVFIRVC